MLKNPEAHRDMGQNATIDASNIVLINCQNQKLIMVVVLFLLRYFCIGTGANIVDIGNLQPKVLQGMLALALHL